MRRVGETKLVTRMAAVSIIIPLVFFWWLLVQEHPDVVLELTFLVFCLLALVSLRTLIFVTMDYKWRCSVLVLIASISGLGWWQVSRDCRPAVAALAKVQTAPRDALTEMRAILSVGKYQARYKVYRSISTLNKKLPRNDQELLSLLYALYRTATMDTYRYPMETHEPIFRVYLDRAFLSVFPFLSLNKVEANGWTGKPIEQNAPRLVTYMHLLSPAMDLGYNAGVDFNKDYPELAAFLHAQRYMIQIIRNDVSYGYYGGTGIKAIRPNWMVKVIDLKENKIALQKEFTGGEPDKSIWVRGVTLRSGQPSGELPVKDFVKWYEEVFGAKP